ncbi:MAG: diguanylate cyclase (GGDEF)-like protein/PAS domain S-box-containing protein [Planctomycetaceae bacterium]|jgi:diguanylate cyclase (GGDEF)-like protein/PAS domain S-box-containing protein
MQTEQLPVQADQASRGPVYPVQATHPMNSSRLLLELMQLGGDRVQNGGFDAVILRSAMRSLMLALQYRDPGIVHHSRRVAALSVGVAEQLGWEARDLQILEAACLLHDIGKVGIPDIILHKPGRLAPDEAELMGLLYRLAGDVLQACGADSSVVQIVTQSQYHFNGATHDFSVIGSDVHQGARILSVADAYDSLVTSQVFREAFGHEAAMDVLQRGAGSQYDGNVISAMIRWFEFEQIPAELLHAREDQYQLSPEEIIEAGSLSHVFSYLYLLESLYHGFYIASTDGCVQVWNHGCQELLGIEQEQIIGQPGLGGLIKYRKQSRRDLTVNECPIRLAIETGRTQSSELEVSRADGRWLAVEVQTLPLIDAAGQLQGVAEIFRDASGGREKGHYRDLRLMASRDALTHVANRGELKKRLDAEFAECKDRDFEAPFSIIFLDVDHFKKCNDTYGHAAGDEVLISVARLLQHEMYSGELVARYGGEEFVVLCPETPLDDAWQKAERLRKALEKATVVKSDEFRITASFGVAQLEPTDEADDVLQRADKALYVSKHQGRNRTSKITSEQLRKHDPEMVKPSLAKPEEFVCDVTLKACMAADMIVYKLKAFVDGNGAKLGKVTAKSVELRLGARGLLSGWGKTADKQPVEILLGIGDSHSTIQRGANKLVEIHVRITPIGRARKVDVFKARCRNVLKDLRQYLAADFDDMSEWG